MKASDFIENLKQMIEKHGDLPLALLEISDSGYSYHFVEMGEVMVVLELKPYEKLIDSNDEVVSECKVFLID